MRRHSVAAPKWGLLLRAAAALVFGCILTIMGVLQGGSPNAQADGNAWQNANGTSTTATGQATIAGGQLAMVFAFATDNPVSGCSSPAGSCSIAAPDGANSFEVFANAATPTVSFSVTTTSPIACAFKMPFKVSLNGSPPYIDETPLTPNNSCPTPPPTATTPCPVTDVSGYFEPTQAVWQDEPDTGYHFDNRPGRQLTEISKTSFIAELPMVKDKPTLLFGIDSASGSPIALAPEDRYNIVIKGVTTGTTFVDVKMKFSGAGSGVTLDYTTGVLASLLLNGPCGTAEPFEVTLPAPLGVPPVPSAAFTFTGTGAYTLRNQLVDANGNPTGLEVDVRGTAVSTRVPVTYFIPLRLSSAGGAAVSATLQKQSDALRDQSDLNIPDYYPLAPGGFPGVSKPLVDLSASLKGDLASWLVWARALLLPPSQTRLDALLANLTDRMALGAILGNVGRVVVVLAPAEMNALGLAHANGSAESQKVVFVRSTASHFTVAHEIAHTLPYIWSSDQMQKQCTADYHNLPIQIGHGFQVTQAGIEHRVRRDPWASFMSASRYRWADQCTYSNLISRLQNPPDPLVLLVRGRLGMNGGRVIGQLFAPYRLNSAVDLVAGTGGSWAIAARAASGRVLARYPFSPQWAGDDRMRRIISFGYRIPATPGIVRLDLVGPGGTLSTLTASPHAPSVSIGAPRGGARLVPSHRTVHVGWVGRDADGKPLLYTVLYSSDGGSTWQAQAVEQRATSFDVALSPGAAHVVRIVVTDGARSGQATVSFTTP